MSEEAAALLGEADRAIKRSYNYSQALLYIEQASQLAPDNAGVLQFYGSVLLALGHIEGAWRQHRTIFRSTSPIAKDPQFLQQYVLTLHRLDKSEELKEVWPRITALPDIHWRSPLQCPDRVDATVLDGATPFPRSEGLRVPEILERHKDDLVADFESFWKRCGGNPAQYFQPNQDNDLVLGNKARQWTEMLLFNKGAWDPRGCKELPSACRILRGLPDIEGIVHGKRSGQVSLLMLEAGTRLVPHFGSVNWRYVAHLGLLVPKGVVMRAGDEVREFAKRELLILDDSFLHSVDHNGTGPRVTLFVNFFHPTMKPLTYEEWLAEGEAT